VSVTQNDTYVTQNVKMREPTAGGGVRREGVDGGKWVGTQVGMDTSGYGHKWVWTQVGMDTSVCL
jgi:hypothetical protein